MFAGVDVSTISFGDPRQLWLLGAPAILLLFWLRQLVLYRRDAGVLSRRRMSPQPGRLPWCGVLPFWLCIIVAVACVIVALARPRGLEAGVRTGGVDIVILQDGSASMRVKDVAGDRWQRSMKFLRVLGDSLAWDNDRLALALFAHIAAPQVRLTSDPNTFFFFLDHLDREPPFRLADDTTWDTNIEQGVYWGLRLIEKDEQLQGPSARGKALVLISDGQAWSGEVERSLAIANERRTPVFVIGVGTPTGGIIPEPPAQPLAARMAAEKAEAPRPITATLDRASLTRIARAGFGAYFEIGRETDHDIANTIIDSVRRSAPSGRREQRVVERYWIFLAAAAGASCLALLAVRERADLTLQALAAATALAVVWFVTR